VSASSNVPFPGLAMTSQALADALLQRFGSRIADAVLASLDIADAVPLEIVEQAVATALDAELAVAGSHFVMVLPISALTNSTHFQRAARQAGVPADRLDTGQRLRVDAAFVRRWRASRGAREPAQDIEHAQATMSSVLLDELS
jgi:hypothetical protein